jgi:hypothetical protein
LEQCLSTLVTICMQIGVNTTVIQPHYKYPFFHMNSLTNFSEQAHKNTLRPEAKGWSKSSLRSSRPEARSEKLRSKLTFVSSPNINHTV